MDVDDVWLGCFLISPLSLEITKKITRTSISGNFFFLFFFLLQTSSPYLSIPFHDF